MALAQIPVSPVQNSLTVLISRLSEGSVEKTLGLPKGRIPKKELQNEGYPEPNYSNMDEELTNLKQLSLLLEQVKEVSSKNRQFLKDTKVELTGCLDRMDLCLSLYRSMPKIVPWKQKVCDKLEHLVTEYEDVMELLELALDTKFIRTIEAQIHDFN